MSTTQNHESPWTIVAGREISIKLRDKNFLISTVSTIAILIASFAVSFALSQRTDTEHIAVADAQAAQLVSAAADAPKTPDTLELIADQKAGDEAVTEAVRSGDADAGLVHGADGWTVIGDSTVDSDVRTALGAAVANSVMDAHAKEAGTDLAALSVGSELHQQLLTEGGNEVAQTIAGFAFVFLFYMAALLFGMSLANSVVAEKESRIVEILAAAIPLRQLLAGKIVAVTVLAVAQMALFVGLALACLAFTDYSSLLPSVAPAAGWYLAFFVFGFVALAALYAVAGALASRTEDVASTSSPILIVVMMAAFAGMLLHGIGRTIASYVPLASTVAMPIRLLNHEAAWWEPIVSLLVTAVAYVAITLFAERLYRRSLMQTGPRLTFRTALKLEG